MGRISAYIFVLILGLFACSKYRGEVDNLNNGEIWKMGHGGMGFGSTYPMNTRESLIQCLSYNMDGTELDVQLTKDNVLVAFHDEELDAKTDFSGKVNAYTWEELKEARYTVLPNLRFEILRLTDLFEMPETKGKIFSFDIKLYPSGVNEEYLANYESQLINLIITYNLQDRCLVESTNTAFLNDIRAALPEIELYFYPGTSFEEGMQEVLANNYDGITISHRQLSKEKVKEAHNLGKKVITWNTQNKKENKIAVSYHPDIIETDEVRFLSKYLE